MWFRLDQIAEYCDEAARHGVTELALTEHSHRFVDVASVVGPFWQRFGHEPTNATMAEYWDFHARNSLEAYVTLAQAAKDEGLPVKIGLEVDYYKDQMDVVSELLAQYPFDVLIGSVHWLGTWQLDDIDSEVNMQEWRCATSSSAGRTTRSPLTSSALPTRWTCSRTPISSRSRVSSRGPRRVLGRDGRIGRASRRLDGVFVGGLEEARRRAVSSRRILGSTRRQGRHLHDRLRRPQRRSRRRTRERLADMLEARGIHEVASYTSRERQMIPLRAG